MKKTLIPIVTLGTIIISISSCGGNSVTQEEGLSYLAKASSYSNVRYYIHTKYSYEMSGVKENFHYISNSLKQYYESYLEPTKESLSDGAAENKIIYQIGSHYVYAITVDGKKMFNYISYIGNNDKFDIATVVTPYFTDKVKLDAYSPKYLIEYCKGNADHISFSNKSGSDLSILEENNYYKEEIVFNNYLISMINHENKADGLKMDYVEEYLEQIDALDLVSYTLSSIDDLGLQPNQFKVYEGE